MIGELTQITPRTWDGLVTRHREEREMAHVGGAFRALAEIGLAIAGGELMSITHQLVGYVGCDRRDLGLLELLIRLNNGRHAVLWGQVP